MKKVAIVQSNYIPWKGYFDLIAAVDQFILGDNSQYTRRDWRNRNRIKTAQGVQWLTVPVKVRGKSLQKIWQTEINDTAWAKDHWRILTLNYQLTGGKTERIANLCIQAGATEYISGPAARAYIDPAVFDAAGIQLTWFDYSGYPEYSQLWGEFEHGVSILDLLFNSGTDAPRHMKQVLL